MKPNDTLANIVVVDDEKYICSIIAEALSSVPYSVQTFVHPAEAMQFIQNHQVDLVLTDLVMGKRSGIEVLDLTRQHHPDAAVIMMTAHPTVQAAISVLKKGAYDFLIKPFKLDILKTTVSRGLEHQRVVRENLQLKEQLEFLKLSRANVMGTEIEEFLNLLVATCKREFSAAAVGILELEPDTNKVLRLVSESEQECNRARVESGDHQLLTRKKFGEPVIESEPVQSGERTLNEVFICQPILVRGGLHGLINILMVEQFGTVTPGQKDLLAILADTAASAIANHNLYTDLQGSYLHAIKALANAIEARDNYTAGHTDRVSRLAECLARYLGWNEEQLRNLQMGCTLHDVGKIGVPDSILNKPDRLTPDEQEKMRNHPTVGLKIIEGIDLLKPAVKYIESHHEWYDGTGYPKGLKGEDIPIEGRLLAVVDTFDAIVSDRPYRKGAEISVALQEIHKYRGRQFDPMLVDGFFNAIRSKKIDLAELYDVKIDTSFLDDLPVSEKVRV
ncbi:MAG: response regulator [bacterium]|nr:response regulator [bacterium]